MGANRRPFPAFSMKGDPPFPCGSGKRTSAIPGIDWRRTAIMSFSVLCYAAAIAIAAYPFVADRLNAYKASMSFTAQRDELASLPSGEARDATDEANAYNEVLAGHARTEGALPYEEQLGKASDGSMCWIEIPRIGVKEPVYRGSDEDELYEALMKGAAHVKGSSLPVGGTSANIVITGHSGMRESSMFDHLDLLQPGDLVILWTMGTPYAYEVVGTELVEPDRLDVMRITEGVDQCTLITCRNPTSTSGFLPGGSFTHRLVVHSERTDWTPAFESEPQEHIADGRSALFGGSLVAAGALFLIASSLALGFRRDWVLDRVVGERALSPGDISRIECEMGTARLRLGVFGNARLDLFGMRVKGRWSHVKPDDCRIRLNFRLRENGALHFANEPQLKGMRLHEGNFIARGLDNELGIGIDRHASTLVFRPEEKDRRRKACRRKTDAPGRAKLQRA